MLHFYILCSMGHAKKYTPHHLCVPQLLLFIIAYRYTKSCVAFVHFNHQQACRKYTFLMTSRNENMAALRFTASFNHTSEPVLLHHVQQPYQAKNILIQFFESTEKRDHLLRGSGNIEVYEPDDKAISSVFPSLIRRWKLERSRFGEDIASSEYDVSFLDLIVETKFLVFNIFVKAIIGFKLIYTPFDNDDIEHAEEVDWEPEYEFLLLAEDFRADGPPPLVFIFNQLTGKGAEPTTYKLSNDMHLHHAYLKVNARLHNDEASGKEKVTFQSASRAEIALQFPSLLLKIIPVPIEIIEREGSRALLKNMKKDVVSGVSNFRRAFVEWADQQYYDNNMN